MVFKRASFKIENHYLTRDFLTVLQPKIQTFAMVSTNIQISFFWAKKCTANSKYDLK